MKNLFSKLFKKGKPESAPAKASEDGDAKSPEEAKKAGDAGKSPEPSAETKSAEAAEEGEAPKASAEAPAATPPPAEAAKSESPAVPVVKESLAGQPPVLKPLYGQDKPAEPPQPKVLPVPPKAGAPAAEPAPPAEAKAAPYQHLPFEGDLKEAIKTLVVDLADVYPQTLEQWEDGFRRDDNPEQEIAAWMHLAAVLKAVDEEYSLAQPEKMECFNLLLACFSGSCETVGMRAERKLLSQEQFERTVASFYEGFVS